MAQLTKDRKAEGTEPSEAGQTTPSHVEELQLTGEYIYSPDTLRIERYDEGKTIQLEWERGVRRYLIPKDCPQIDGIDPKIITQINKNDADNTAATYSLHKNKQLLISLVRFEFDGDEKDSPHTLKKTPIYIVVDKKRTAILEPNPSLEADKIFKSFDDGEFQEASEQDKTPFLSHLICEVASHNKDEITKFEKWIDLTRIHPNKTNHVEREMFITKALESMIGVETEVKNFEEMLEGISAYVKREGMSDTSYLIEPDSRPLVEGKQLNHAIAKLEQKLNNYGERSNRLKDTVKDAYASFVKVVVGLTAFNVLLGQLNLDGLAKVSLGSSHAEFVIFGLQAITLLGSGLYFYKKQKKWGEKTEAALKIAQEKT